MKSINMFRSQFRASFNSTNRGKRYRDKPFQSIPTSYWQLQKNWLVNQNMRKSAVRAMERK
jgi:hypothetical protein